MALHAKATSKIKALKSPLEPGIWLVPAKATAITPPIDVDPFSLVWNGEHWELAPDPEIEPEAASEVISQPQPEPLPDPVELTPAERLAAAGLTVEELKELLGIT
jgi:hypothetical protein